MAKAKTHKDFINELEQKQPILFEEIYFIEEYKTCQEKILVKDKYGVLTSTPSNLLKGRKPTILSAVDKTKYFLEELKHRNFDIYINISISGEYINDRTPILCGTKFGNIIITRPRRLFDMTLDNFLMCAENKTRMFINMAKETHGDKYNYSESTYTSSDKDVTINCLKHGNFKQLPSNHISGQGCPKCGKEKSNICKTKTKSQFIEESISVHGDKFEYKNVEYINNQTKVEIFCRKHHLHFYQTPSSHLKSKLACPKCNSENRDSHFYNEKIAIRYKEKWTKIDSYLYILKFYNEEEEFFKIGVARNGAKKRHSKHYGYNMDIIQEINTNQYLSIVIEQKIIKKMKMLKYTPKIKFPGYTECFSVLDDIIICDIIQEYLDENYNV